jgi:hypothetical protein
LIPRSDSRHFQFLQNCLACSELQWSIPHWSIHTDPFYHIDLFILILSLSCRQFLERITIQMTLSVWSLDSTTQVTNSMLLFSVALCLLPTLQNYSW